MSKFRVGDEVKVINNFGDSLYNRFIGLTRKIVGINPYSERYELGGVHAQDDESQPLVYWDESELELVQKEETMDYKSALKACLDGHKVTLDGFIQPWYIYFDGEKFMRKNGNYVTELDFKGKWVVSSKDWKILKPEPKFSKDDLFISKGGRIGKVVSYIDNSEYNVIFDFKENKTQVYHESKMTKFVYPNVSQDSTNG